MKILVENSTWNNIGDGFYQSTLFMLLTELYPNDQVYMEEGPMIRAFRPKTNRQKKNMFELMNYQKADIHVFSGPILRQLINHYGDKIESIFRNNNKYVLISVSGAGSSVSEVEKIGSFLQKYPPLFFSTRDEETYTKYKEFVPKSYNGICTAFLVNHYLPVDDIILPKPFFISSFYRELEPVYSIKGNFALENLEIVRKKKYTGLSNKYGRHLNWLRPQQSDINGHNIIRVRQDVSTHFKHVKFSHPNSFMSFNLLSYLALYKSAAFTVSDRVHSCAVTLAYGKPAKLITDSPRAGIFDRMGIDYKSNDGLIYPNLERFDEEIQKLKIAIKENI